MGRSGFGAVDDTVPLVLVPRSGQGGPGAISASHRVLGPTTGFLDPAVDWCFGRYLRKHPTYPTYPTFLLGGSIGSYPTSHPTHPTLRVGEVG